MISIIIRTKNEERWILECLKRIDEQIINEKIEIILVDNKSDDETVNKALSFNPNIKVVTIDKYYPGKAINLGVENSQGEFFAVISAHCIPENNNWLKSLRYNFEDPKVAGVYGRQIPMNFTPDVDKRDLLVTFGLDKIVQKKGTFFHNANSMVRRTVWEQIQFDNNITNIEDRIWGKKIISKGYHLVYEPDACVFHYHGIHQKNKNERLKNVIRIFDEYEIQGKDEKNSPINIEELAISAVIPFRSKDIKDDDLKVRLFNKAYNDLKKSKFIDRIILFTDDAKLLKHSKNFTDVDAPIKRSNDLDDVRLAEVFSYLLQELAQKNNYYPDIVIPIELIYPFRPDNIFDDLIKKLTYGGLDTVVPGYKEYRACWRKEKDIFKRLDRHELNRNERDPLHIGVLGLGFATYPELLRKEIKYGDKLGIIEYDNPLIKIEMRSNEQIRYADNLLGFESDLNI